VSDYDAILALQRLGFSEYEAKAYVTLLSLGPISGYALAKHSRIPRANVYRVLDRLLERQAVCKVQSLRGAQYQAVPVERLSHQLAEECATDLRQATNLLHSLSAPSHIPLAWQIDTRVDAVDAAKALIVRAEKQLVIALWPNEAKEIAAELMAAKKSGVNMTTLCMAACAQECGGCPEPLYRCRAGALRDRRSLIVVADNREVLIADLDDCETSAIRTQRPLVVALASSYVLQSILIGSILDDTAPTVLDELDRVVSEDILLERARIQYAGNGGGFVVKKEEEKNV
jgi:predicted transcriptional regulator